MFSISDKNGNIFKVKLNVTEYIDNKTLAIEILYFNQNTNDYEKYENLTTNIEGIKEYPKNFAFVKKSMIPFVKTWNIGEITNKKFLLNFDIYYLVEFDLEKIKKGNKE